ncbi:MAG: hypothetical protein DLM54_09755 [Acidimicrobiales bacterium]|nr:MAG: hypothetical protein DLM54_09755 [Acidimicrobiales bacterium]
MSISATIILSRRGVLALDERVRMVSQATRVTEIVAADKPSEAVSRLVPGSLAYLLDVNAVTAAAAAALWAKRRPYVVDTGDDPATLARPRRGSGVAVAHGTVERLMLSRASGVVCRGWFHQQILRAKTSAPLLWAPDTVPDQILDDRGVTTPLDDLVSSFGSASIPLTSDRAYGWEVVDLVARQADLRGLLVVNGPGIMALRTRAARLGVSARIQIEPAMPLRTLAGRLAPAGFVTSVQSDDLAGWVRTTGKLPIALGMGKALLATRVGEASRILPDCLLVSPGPDSDLIDQLAGAIAAGVPNGWDDRARALAERYRRSTVAFELGSYLGSLEVAHAWRSTSR